MQVGQLPRGARRRRRRATDAARPAAFCLAESIVGALQLEAQRCGPLKGPVHGEDVVARRDQHAVLAGEDHGLEDVDELRDVGHPHAIAVGVQDVQADCRGEGVAQGVLLAERGRFLAGFRVVPRAPFIQDECHAPFGIRAVHDRTVGSGGCRPVEALATTWKSTPSRRIPLRRLSHPSHRSAACNSGRSRRRNTGRRPPSAPRSMSGRRPRRPRRSSTPIFGRGSDERRKPAVFLRVPGGRHLASATPRLVPEAEVGNRPWLRPAVAPAQLGKIGIRFAGQVLSPVGELARRAAATLPLM